MCFFASDNIFNFKLKSQLCDVIIDGYVYVIKCSVMTTLIKRDEEMCFLNTLLSSSRCVCTLFCFQEYQSFGWWVGEKNGNIGIVPKDYLMELYAL